MPDTTIDLDTIMQRLQQYPVLGVDIQDAQATLIIVLGPGTTITQAVTDHEMNDICHKWLSRHKK